MKATNNLTLLYEALSNFNIIKPSGGSTLNATDGSNEHANQHQWPLNTITKKYFIFW